VRIVALGDVGVVDGMMHIGDEAMFEALVDELRLRGATSITALSAAPAETAARYGVEAVSRLGFPGDRDAGAARFAAVLECAAGRRALPDGDPVWAVLDAVAASDGVVIAGGGNLASTWPSHIFERAALAAIATAAGRPLVVSGQTLGPSLDPGDRELVRGLLAGAQRVGLREADSVRFAAELGAPGSATLDDASFLGFDEPADAADPFLLVSLSTHLGGRPRDAVVTGLAAALDALHADTGMPIRFHAHFGSLEPGVVRGDAVLHDEVRAALRSDSEVVPTGDPRDAARLARSAGLLVTGRYHPAVFAAPAGVPIAALVVDAYTDVKLRGVLGHWEQTGLIDLDTVARGEAGIPFRRIAALAPGIAESTEALRPGQRSRAADWWDRVAADLSPAAS
jgi:polysaccharide pyruvyl transferase WcaK-like protein